MSIARGAIRNKSSRSRSAWSDTTLLLSPRFFFLIIFMDRRGHGIAEQDGGHRHMKKRHDPSSREAATNRPGGDVLPVISYRTWHRQFGYSTVVAFSLIQTGSQCGGSLNFIIAGEESIVREREKVWSVLKKENSSKKGLDLSRVSPTRQPAAVLLSCLNRLARAVLLST